MKKSNEKFFDIDPLCLVKGRTITFDVCIVLPVNDRVIVFRGKGITLDDVEPIVTLMKRGLKRFHVRESERELFNAYFQEVQKEKAAQQARELALEEAEEKAAAAAAEAAKLPPDAQVAKEVEQGPANVAALEAKAPPPPDDEKAKTPYQPTKEPEKVMEGLLSPAPENIKAREDAKEMIREILTATDAPKEISDIINNPDTEHATSVAIYATLFAMGLKKSEQQILQDIIVASLIHDIGLTQIDPFVLTIPEAQRAGAQNAAYQAHVFLGMAMLGDLDYLPNKRVIMLLNQHHEKFNGSGYPQHLESFRVDELAQVIHLADFIDTVVRGRYDGTVRSLSDALLEITKIEKSSTFPEHFNPDIFKRVMNWLKKGGGMDYLAAAEESVHETRQKLLKTG